MKLENDRTIVLNRYKSVSGAIKNVRRGETFAMLALEPYQHQKTTNH